MAEKKIWVQKPKEERKKVILEILKEKKEMTLSNLIHNYYDQIGVALDEKGKVSHQAWEVVRSDCKSLEKEGKISLKKDEFGKILIKIYDATGEVSAKAEESTLEKITPLEESKDYEELLLSLNQLKNKIDKLRNEILEIWKLLSKAPSQETLRSNKFENFISSLEELIKKFK